MIAVAAWNVSAQVQFSMTPQTYTATVNEQVSFEVKVRGFNQIEGYQFTYAFDPAKLEFLGFGPNLASPVLLPPIVNTSDKEPSLISKGQITVVWATPTGNPNSLADGTTIATLVFKSKINGAVAAGFSDTPLAPEVFGPGVLQFPVTFSFSPALNTLGGGGGNNPCNPDVTAPSFGATCPQNISLTTTTTCAVANWTAPTATDGCGNATVTQTAGLTSGACFNIGQNTVTYRATDLAGNTAQCSFVVDVAADNGNTGNPCVNNWTYPAVGSDLAIVLSEELVEKANDLATVKVMVSNFTLIQGLSFSLNWESGRLQFVSIKDDKINLPGASLAGNFNLTNAANGVLGFNWDDPSTKGQTLNDKSVVFEIVFRKLGPNDGNITFSNTPVDINAVKEINSNAIDIQNFTRIGGKVKICSSTNPTPCNTSVTYNDDLNIKNVVISANGEVCLDVVVNRFTNIDGLETIITWDATRLQFTRIESGQLTLVEGTEWYRFPGENKIKIVFLAQGNPITLSNGEVAFRICFQATGGLNSVATVSFDPTATEITSNSIIKQGVTLGNGTVTIKALPNVSLNSSGICGSTGTLTATISNPSGAYTYIWSGPSFTRTTTTNTVTITNPGAYRVTVQDANCLSGTATTTAVATIATTINSIVQNEQGLLASASSPTYSWALASNPNGVISTDALLSSPQAGVEYILTAGIGTCVVKRNILAIGVTPDITNVRCGGEKSGRINLTISGTTSALNYTWSGNLGNTKDVSGLGAGNYAVTITSSDGRVNTVRNFTITEPNPLIIAGTPSSTNAPNGTIDVEVQGGTGNLTYNWTGFGDNPTYTWPTPPPFNGSTTQDLVGLEPGTYRLTVTDANGCTVTTSQVINVQPISVALKDNKTTATTCGLNNGAIELVVKGGSGNYRYNWSNSAVPSVANPNNLASGAYLVTVTDLKYNLITVFSNMFILPSDGPIIAVSQVVDAGDNCKGSIDLNLTGGEIPYTYRWAGPTVNIAPIKNPTNLCEGVYSVTVTDNKGCTAVKTDINVAGAGRPCPVVTKLTQTSCPDSRDGEIDLSVPTGKAPFTFQWRKDGKSYNATTEDLTNLGIGLYAVTITDALNKTCEKNDILVSSKSDLKVDANVIDPTPNNAKNGSLTLIVSGGSGNYQYRWEDNVGTNNTAINLRAGTYTVTVTDINLGCSIIKTFVAGDPASVEIAIRSVFNGVNIRCFGMCNGIAEIKTVDDATPPLKFKWSNGDTSRIAKGLCVGTHRVTVTDANNEIFEGVVTLVGPENLLVTIKTDATNKSAEAIVKGGTSPYNFVWQDKSTDSKILNQEKGRVFVMITDANGCDAFANGYIGDTDLTLACLESSNPIITPNNDGYNDVLDVYCLEKYPTNRVQVFNRWGQIVFDKSNYANRTWSGTDISGKPLPNGAYFYVVTVQNTDGQEEIAKGSFSILNE
jgi:gliding motility-associated-like protein